MVKTILTPRLTFGAPRSTRIKKPKFSPWVWPQSNSQGSAGCIVPTSVRRCLHPKQPRLRSPQAAGSHKATRRFS